MTTPTSELVVRQHERRACRVSCILAVAPDPVRRVVLSRNVGDGQGGVTGAIVDASRGGIGVESPVFLPRGSVLVVSVPRETVAGDDNGGAPIELRCRVQRTTMVNRKPLYYLGLAYADSADREMISAVLRRAGVGGDGVAAEPREREGN